MSTHKQSTIKEKWLKATTILSSVLVFSGLGAGLFGSSRAFGLGPKPVYAGQQENGQKQGGIRINQDAGEHIPQPFSGERPRLMDAKYIVFEGNRYLQSILVDVRGIDVGKDAQQWDRHFKGTVKMEWRPKQRGMFYTLHLEGNDGTKIDATFEYETGVIYGFKGTSKPPKGPVQQLTSGYKQITPLGSHLAKLAVWAVNTAYSETGAPPHVLRGTGQPNPQKRRLGILGF